MTTIVTVQAHCSDDKEVVIVRHGVPHTDTEVTIIQNGETYTNYVYDGYSIEAYEVLKTRTLS
jgi:hypothetical protein